MRNPENKRRWDDIVTTTKRSLLSILIDDMEEQYQATEAIDTQPRQHLTPKDWEEVSATLDRKYKAAVPGQRSQRIFPRDRKENG